MNSTRRREKIIELLSNTAQPVSAVTIAGACNVSRQIVVGDIALMRASGVEIVATPRGYILPNIHAGQQSIHTIACNHSAEDTQKEIYTIVDNGGGLINVTVEHPIYGQLCGELHIYSRYDADLFFEKVRNENIPLLSILTGGLHLHNICCGDEAALIRIKDALRRESILFDRNIQ